MTVCSVEWLSDISKISILLVIRNNEISWTWLCNPLELHVAILSDLAISSYFIYNCGEHGQYHAALIFKLVKHVFEFIKEDCELICCIRVMAVSGLNQWSFSSCLCIAYGGMGIGCGWLWDWCFFLDCLCFLSLLVRGRRCSLYNWPDDSRCIKHIFSVFLGFSYMLLCRVVHHIWHSWMV